MNFWLIVWSFTRESGMSRRSREKTPVCRSTRCSVRRSAWSPGQARPDVSQATATAQTADDVERVTVSNAA